MLSTLDPTLLQKVMQLPEEQRSELASRLLESLDDVDTAATPQEIKAAWVAELDRRAAEGDSGAVPGVSYDEAWRQIAGPDE
jgi:putative addiction module component (TIGR02574 family)